MLSVSRRAATVIRGLTAQRSGKGQALRIAPSSTPGKSPGFSLSVCGSPDTNDQIVESHGIRVFVDVAASPALRNKVLDVDVDPDGRTMFYIAGGKTPRAKPG